MFYLFKVKGKICMDFHLDLFSVFFCISHTNLCLSMLQYYLCRTLVFLYLSCPLLCLLISEDVVFLHLILSAHIPHTHVAHTHIPHTHISHTFSSLLSFMFILQLLKFKRFILVYFNYLFQSY